MAALHIILNCRDDELTRERAGFYSALCRVAEVIVSPVNQITPNGLELNDGRWLSSQEITALWHLDPLSTPIPKGLPSLSFPTLWVHMDGGTAPEWRSIWSGLFDVACLCAWDGKGYKRGSYRIVFQPYAARLEWNTKENKFRELEIGWVGKAAGHIYKKRAHLLPRIAARYRMNDWQREVPEDEVLPIYRRSKIVVNIQRDDYQSWYNVRCFEAFAAGSLVFIEKPTHLEDVGFRDGIHFIGYSSEDELFKKIDFYLANESQRMSVAEVGRDFVFKNHTYDNRVAELIAVMMEEDTLNRQGRRRPTRAEIGFYYLHYFCKKLMLPEATAEFKKLLYQSPAYSLRGLPVLLRCWHHITRTNAYARLFDMVL